MKYGHKAADQGPAEVGQGLVVERIGEAKTDGEACPGQAVVRVGQAVDLQAAREDKEADLGLQDKGC